MSHEPSAQDLEALSVGVEHAVGTHARENSRTPQSTLNVVNTSLETIETPLPIPGVSQSAIEGQPPLCRDNIASESQHHSLKPPPLSTPLRSQSSTATVPAGFILHSTIAIFASKLLAELYEYHGPIPKEIHVTDKVPSYELAILQESCNLRQLFPNLVNTAFSAIDFSNLMVIRQTAAFDKTKAVGWTLEGDATIGEETFDTLTKILGVDIPVIHLSAELGDSGACGWLEPFSLHDLVLKGPLPANSVPPRPGFSFTQIGVRLTAIPSSDHTSTLSYGFTVHGQMHLKVPHEELSVPLEFELTQGQDGWKMDATLKDNVWTNAFGVPGLILTDVSLTAALKPGAFVTAINFEASAVLHTQGGPIILHGSCAPDDHFSLSASLTDIRWDSVNGIYHALKGKTLTTPDIDVSINAATVVISSDTGLTMTVHGMSIGNFVSADASVDFSLEGLRVHGVLSKPVHFEGLQLQNAVMQVSLASASSGGRSVVTLIGDIAFLDRVLSAAVYLNRGDTEEGIPPPLDWIVYAFMSKDKALTLVDLNPELRGSFLQDVALHRPVLVISSSDEPQLPKELNISVGAVSKGIQICATLGQLSSLNSLTRSTTLIDDLYLKAGWSPELGFNLDVTVLSLADISLGHGTKLNPGHITIVSSPQPSLLLSASIDVPVSKQTEPLVFDVVLSVDAISVSATGEMHGYWVNPFGIGNNLKIGPSLALKIEVILAQFLATGTPSGFGFSGNLQMGKIVAQLEFDVSETATGELLHGKLDSLDIEDVVTFVKDISGLDIPSPPPFANFQSIDLYMSPLGATVGSRTYPAGASFSADVILFGVRGNILTSMNTSGFKIHGNTDQFKLGPFIVSGAKETSGPVMDVEFDEAIQHVSVDGTLQLFDVFTVLQFTFDVTPRPDFAVKFALSFIDKLTFTVDGSLFGSPNLEDLAKIDFQLQAVFQQEILEYITHEVTQEFAKAREFAHQDIQAAEADVSRYQQLVADGLSKAQIELDRTRTAWEAKSAITHTEAQKVFDEYEGRKKQLDVDVCLAREELQKALGDASMGERQVNDTHTEAQRSSEDEKKLTQNQLELELKDAENARRLAEDRASSLHADIQKGIDFAQRAVDGAQSELEDINRTIHDAETAPWWNAPAKASLPALYVNRMTSEGEVAAANGLLDAAKARLYGPKYLHVQDTAETARKALEAVQNTSQSAEEAAGSALNQTDKYMRPVISGGEDRLVDVSHGPLRLARLHGAEDALAAHIASQASSVATAQKAVDDLEKTDEWRNYQAAIIVVDSTKHTTERLTLAEIALTAAKGRWNSLTNMTTWAAKHSLVVLDVKSVTLSGSFHDLANVKGYLGFDATIDGTIIGQSFRLSPVLDLRSPEKFIGSIFTKLWEDIENERIKVLPAV